MQKNCNYHPTRRGHYQCPECGTMLCPECVVRQDVTGSLQQHTILLCPKCDVTVTWVGAVVIAWDDSLRGGRVSDDGHNVVLHEFAHQLDQEDGVADGTPILGERSRYREWIRIFSCS